MQDGKPQYYINDFKYEDGNVIVASLPKLKEEYWAERHEFENGIILLSADGLRKYHFDLKDTLKAESGEILEWEFQAVLDLDVIRQYKIKIRNH